MPTRSSRVAFVLATFLVVGGAASVFSPTFTANTLAAMTDAPRDAKDILKASAEAIAKAKAFSYRAIATTEGPLSAGTPKYDAMVTAVRADVGGWKLAVSGTAATTAKDVNETSKLELGYDGASAWSLRERDKVAFTESIRKESDVEKFFKRNSAGPAVAWDLLDAKPLDLGGTPALDGEGKAGGEDCVIIKITDAKTDGDPGRTARIFIAKKDDLPRRIERIREISDTDGSAKSVVRVLELAQLKTDKDVAAVPFTLSAPDGYTIKTAPGAPREAKKPADENPLKGPGVKDKDGDKGQGGDSMMASGKREAFPDFKLKDADGKEFTLDSYKGDIVVLDFWATWCHWCVKGMPDVQKLHENYKNNDKVKVVGLNLFEEKPEAAVKFMKSKNYTYGLLLRGDDLGKKLGINGIPELIIVDGNGKIIQRLHGYNADMLEKVTKIIDKELAATKK